MDLRQLRSFLAVVDHETFVAASQALFLAQSSVSDHVATLERELGVALFDRTRRRVRLTDAGADVVLHARRMLALEGELRDAAHPIDRRPWRLALGGGDPSDFYAALRAVDHEAPARPVTLHDVPADERAGRVRGGSLDAALLHGDVDTEGLVALPMPAEALRVVTSIDHPAASGGGRTLSLAELADDPLGVVGSARGSAALREIQAACREVGCTPRLTSLTSLRAIALSPRVWTFAYASLADRLDVERQQLAVFHLTPAREVATTLVCRAQDADYARRVLAGL